MPQTHDEIYILYACDQWKSRDSLRMVGATTDRDTLYTMMAHEIFESRMDFQGETGVAGVKRFREEYRKGYVPAAALSYGYVSESYNLDCRSAGVSPPYNHFHQLLNMGDEEFRRSFPVLEDTPDAQAKAAEKAMADERNRLGMFFDHDIYRQQDGLYTLVDPWDDTYRRLPLAIPEVPETCDVSFYVFYHPDNEAVKYVCLLEDSGGERMEEVEITEREAVLLKDGMEWLCQGDHQCDLETFWGMEATDEPDWEDGMEL